MNSFYREHDNKSLTDGLIDCPWPFADYDILLFGDCGDHCEKMITKVEMLLDKLLLDKLFWLLLFGAKVLLSFPLSFLNAKHQVPSCAATLPVVCLCAPLLLL